ncbi:MAG: mechanosensitive ion channel family protein, partial [Polyangiaceae bacterium]|nr:mechanosensitive ion channel family protein [Polyangiaceae bacterium]
KPTPRPSATVEPSASAPPPAPSAEPTAEPAPSASAAPSAPPPPVHVAEEAADVRIGDTLAFQIRAKHGDQSAADRARAATKALKDAFDGASPDDVHVEKSADAAIVYLGTTPIVQLAPEDAIVAGDASLDVHADAVAAGLRKAIRAEKDRTALASRIFSISLVIFFGILVVYLIRKIGDFAERANAWVDDNPHRIPAIRVRTLTMLTPAAFRSALAGAIGVGKWFAQFAIGYLWLLAALSLFETTRGYTDKLNGILLQPFVALTTRIAASLPITLVVLIAGLVVAILFRVIGLFFESVRTGTTEVEWIPPELARPTSTLMRVALVLTTMVFAGPVLTGNPEGALARGGFIGIITLGLASVPIVASCTVGLVVVYGRRYRVGEHVRVGPTKGKVVEIGLADVTLEDDDGNETRIPHLVTLLRPIELLGVAPRISVRLTIPRSEASEITVRNLLEALMTVGTDPRVEIESIEREIAQIGLSVLSDELDAKNRMVLAAVGALNGGMPKDAPTSSRRVPGASERGEGGGGTTQEPGRRG